MSWIDCVVDNDYQIYTEEPYQIRRKSNKRIAKEYIHKSSRYIRVVLNQRVFLKHRILALQFIPNPLNLEFIDHINRIRSDNRIDNLRWVSNSENQQNKSSYAKYIYNYANKISDDSFEITTYGKHQFEHVYYSPNADKFYYYNGVQFRELQILKQPNMGYFVRAYDIEHKQVRINLNTFKKIYDIPI